MAQPGGASLTAIDAETGDRRWRLEPDGPGGTFAEVGGRRILDWTLAALRANWIDRIGFIGGATRGGGGCAN